MSNFYRIRNIVKDLEVNNEPALQTKLIEELILVANAYKQDIIKGSNKNSKIEVSTSPIKVEKIAEEVFLYKPVTVKNYYDGDYLERFSHIRTSDLKDSGALNVHNKFWKAHEVVSGNIFATVPRALLTARQSAKLEYLHWDPVNVDIYEIPQKIETKFSRNEIMGEVSRLFQHYILLRELHGNILMVLHYKLKN